MREYLEVLNKVLYQGAFVADRTGTGTLATFGERMEFDLRKGFPLVTTKKVFTKAIVHELLWFLKGSNNIQYLKENGVRIWDEWAKPNGDIGPIYGVQWRSWPKVTYRDDAGWVREDIDQLQQVIDEIKRNPASRRLLVSAWNVSQIEEMSLPACHVIFQFSVMNGELSCQLYQRSADLFLGVPFNIASYALLTHMVAHVCGLRVGRFIHILGDAHIYRNHISQVREQLSREPRQKPMLWLNPNITSIDDFRYEDIRIEGYESHPKLEGVVSI